MDFCILSMDEFRSSAKHRVIKQQISTGLFDQLFDCLSRLVFSRLGSLLCLKSREITDVRLVVVLPAFFIDRGGDDANSEGL